VGWKEEAPSISHFEAWRGGGGFEGHNPLHLTQNAREGDGGGCKGDGPLRLVFQLREGDGGGFGGRNPPLPRFSSEGGRVVGCGKEMTPSVSLETRGRGMVVA